MSGSQIRSDRVQNEVHGWPTLRAVADIVDVAPSTVTRWNLAYTRLGRSNRIDPSAVVVMAKQRQLLLPVIARKLIAIGEQFSPEIGELVAARVRAAVREVRESVLSETEFLAEARRVLPPDVYAVVAGAYPRPERSPRETSAPRRRPRTGTRRGGSIESSPKRVAASGV